MAASYSSVGFSRFARRRYARTARWVLVCAGVVLSRDAWAAPTVDRCLESYDEFQQRRDDGDLVGARRALAGCGGGACPLALQRECTESLKDLSPRIPTIILVAHGPRREDLVHVVVATEGVTLKSSLDGRELEINPGPHKLRFESPGLIPVEQDIVVREREKGRVIEVTLAPIARTEHSPTEPTPEPLRTTAHTASIPLLTWIFGAVGVAAFGSASAFGIAGLSARADANRCKPNCTQGDVDRVNQRFLGADISLGIGVLAAAAAAWVYFTQARTGETPVSSR
jgi:hypothetical protein